MCLTSLAHKVLSQVDGWRVDACGRGGGGIGALEQSSSRMGFVSNPGASHKQPVSHNPPHAWLRTIASFACIREGEKTSPN